MAIRSHLNASPKIMPQDLTKIPQLPKLNMPNRYYAIHVQTKFVMIFIDAARFSVGSTQTDWLTKTYNDIAAEYTTNSGWQKPWWILVSHRPVELPQTHLFFHVILTSHREKNVQKTGSLELSSQQSFLCSEQVGYLEIEDTCLKIHGLQGEIKVLKFK
jgi:hypothetical protein